VILTAVISWHAWQLNPTIQVQHALSTQILVMLQMETLLERSSKCWLQPITRRLLCVCNCSENIGECIVFKWIDVVREFLESETFNSVDHTSPTAGNDIEINCLFYHALNN